MDPLFKGLLASKDPRALLLLAYWYAKVCGGEGSGKEQGNGWVMTGNDGIRRDGNATRVGVGGDLGWSGNERQWWIQRRARMEGSAIVIYLQDLMDRGRLDGLGKEEIRSLLEFPRSVFGMMAVGRHHGRAWGSDRGWELGREGEKKRREEDKVVLAAFL